MNKILCYLVGVMFTILMGIAGWWINGVNEHCQIVDQLQFRSTYLVGNLPAAPLSTPEPTPRPKR